MSRFAHRLRAGSGTAAGYALPSDLTVKSRSLRDSGADPEPSCELGSNPSDRGPVGAGPSSFQRVDPHRLFRCHICPANGHGKTMGPGREFHIASGNTSSTRLSGRAYSGSPTWTARTSAM